MYQDTSSPSFSSRNIFLMPKSFRRSRIRHCSSVSEIQKRDSEGGSVVFDRRPSSISPVIFWPPWLLPPLCSLLIRAPQGLLAGRERRCRAVPSTPASSATPAAFRLGRQTSPARFAAIQHRPSHREAPRGRPLVCEHSRAIVVAWDQKPRSLPPVSSREPFCRISELLSKDDQSNAANGACGPIRSCRQLQIAGLAPASP